MEELILKYKKAKQSQVDLKQQTPLTNAAQHQLLDQNIHLFNGILNDLRALAERLSVPQANELLPHVSGSAFDIEELQTLHAGMLKAKPHMNKLTKGYMMTVAMIKKLSYLIREHYR